MHFPSVILADRGEMESRTADLLCKHLGIAVENAPPYRGDLKGIMSRLDYIKSIGVTAIWLNPVYVSGWTDGGYDVIDFYRVDKRFGTNSDLVELIRQAHARGIKVVMDLVAGHSSDQNEWFLQSKEAPDLRYSDYYIWPSFKPEEPAQAGPMDLM